VVLGTVGPQAALAQRSLLIPVQAIPPCTRFSHTPFDMRFSRPLRRDSLPFPTRPAQIVSKLLARQVRPRQTISTDPIYQGVFLPVRPRPHQAIRGGQELR
jgi:hypothetical protein